ncbi:MAG: Glutathione-regulated potassium-efflux system protein KefC [Microgenomates bacterium OLB22]|nr:MAG: Glutathione-regulated potassium-efflux system protein KefC [Microgenomates bacterium OLB22]
MPLLCGYFAVRFRSPTVIGYIIAGFFIALLKEADVSSVVSFFANLGLLLLLFTLGLELDITTLRRHGRVVVLAGLLQVGLTTVGTICLLAFFNFNLTTALLLGFALSLSSTAVVSKIIQERGDEHTLPGQLAIGILILQDIVAIPAILVISSYNPDLAKPDLFIAVSASVLKSIGILGLMYVFGERVIPQVFEKLGKVSRELMNLFTIVFIFLLVGIFRYLGLSTGLAAFFCRTLDRTNGTALSYLFPDTPTTRCLCNTIFCLLRGKYQPGIISTSVGEHSHIFPLPGTSQDSHHDRCAH